MKEWIEYTIAYTLLIFILLMPEYVLKMFTKLIIPVAKIFLYRRQRLVLKNLFLSLSSKTTKEILNIANNVWYNIAWTFISTIKYLYNPNKIFSKVKFKNKLVSIPPNSIILTAHIGNWELLAQRLVLEGYKIAAIVRQLRNKIVDKKIKKLREKLGGKVFYEHQLKEVMEWLKSGGIIYILPDQHIAEGSLRVEFLGRLAFTTPIVTLLNKKLKSKIFPMFCIMKNDRYEVVVEKEYQPQYTNNFKRDLEYNTLQMNKVIEKYIKLYPEQWMWLHNRWKEK